MEPSKSLQLNEDDGFKILKSSMLAAAGVASVMMMNKYGMIDADIMSAVYASVSAWLLNTLMIWIKGK